MHFALSTPNFLIQEDMLADVQWRWEVVESALKTENGYWLPCDEPGLGVKGNERAAARHPCGQGERRARSCIDKLQSLLPLDSDYPFRGRSDGLLYCRLAQCFAPILRVILLCG